MIKLINNKTFSVVIEVLTVDPLGNHVGGVFPLPLWAHMSYSMHGNEVQSCMVFLVARHLSISEPRSPETVVINGPA